MSLPYSILLENDFQNQASRYGVLLTMKTYVKTSLQYFEPLHAVQVCSIKNLAVTETVILNEIFFSIPSKQNLGGQFFDLCRAPLQRGAKMVAFRMFCFAA